jgi:hypothetical protein
MTDNVIPFRRPGPPPKTGVPPHIKAELARLREQWAARHAEEAAERRAYQARLLDDAAALTAGLASGPRCEPGRWLPAWAVQEATTAQPAGGPEAEGGALFPDTHLDPARHAR